MSKKAPTAAAFGIKVQQQPALREARVERDETGRIIRVIRRPNPLNDPLSAFDTDEDKDADSDAGSDDGWTGLDDGEHEDPRVVRELQRQAAQPVEKKMRHQSNREIEWLQKLVDRHGDDTAAMARDVRLNRMQQTEADIARRIRLWKGTMT
jgi:nucleolar protein 16